jgi:cytochrome c biogenesis protein CcdA
MTFTREREAQRKKREKRKMEFLSRSVAAMMGFLLTILPCGAFAYSAAVVWYLIVYAMYMAVCVIVSIFPSSSSTVRGI